MLNPRQLEAFAAIVRTGTTIAAAEALHTSQPSISRMLRDLEAETGIRLFVREGSRLKITREGQSFYDEINRYYAGLTYLENRITEIRNLKDSELRLATIFATTTFLIPRVLTELKEVYPELGTNVAARSHSRVLEMVSTGRADVGICNELGSTDSVTVCDTWELECLAAFPAEHSIRSSDFADLDDLAELPFISLGEHFNSTHAESKSHAKQLNEMANSWTNLSIPAIFQVAAGLGATIIDPFSAPLAQRMGLQTRRLAQTVRYPVSLIQTKAVPVSHTCHFVVERLKADITGGATR